ncbi:hypothetical protein ACI2KR_07400 [Pseudomonas luteola]
MGTRKEIEASFEKIALRISQLPNRPEKTCPVVLEGGASLFMHGIKESYRDIDWFIPERWVKYNEIEAIRHNSDDIRNNMLTEGFTFDPTFDSKVEKVVSLNGIDFELRSMSPAMNILFKLHVGRDKDFTDIQLIFGSVTPENVVDAINDCIRINEHEHILNIASQALSEIGCYYFLENSPKELKHNTQSLINRLEFDYSTKQNLARSFGINLETKYNPAHDQWSSESRKKTKSFPSLDM